MLIAGCKIVEVNESVVSWGEWKIFKCHIRESFKGCDEVVSWLLYTVCIFEMIMCMYCMYPTVN